MINLPKTFDRETRAEFLRYLGETFQYCISTGMTAEQARQFAIEFVNEKARGYEQQTQ